MSVLSLFNSYLDLNSDVLHAATNNRYEDNNDISLVNSGPIPLFSKYKSTTSSRKHLEDFSHAHVIFSMYKLLTSAKDTGDLSIGFDRGRKRRQGELTKNKIQRGNFQLRIFFKRHFWICRTPTKS